jgi:segregation and condensation protein A
VVSVAHLHAPQVSVSEQLLLVRNQLVRSGTATFRALTSDCGHTLEVVGRFLALLELYRQQRVVFEQLTPLGELHVRWTGGPLPSGDDEDADPDLTSVEHVEEEYS